MYYDWQAGQEAGGEAIVEIHHGYVRLLAGRYADYLNHERPGALEFADLEMVGDQTVLEQAARYNPVDERNSTFLNYAGSGVFGAITREFYSLRGATRPANTAYHLINGLAKAQKIESLAGDHMSDAALALYLEYEEGVTLGVDGRAIALYSKEPHNVPSLRFFMEVMEAGSLEARQDYETALQHSILVSDREPPTEPLWERGLPLDYPIASAPTADELFDVVAVRAAIASAYREPGRTKRDQTVHGHELAVLNAIYGIDHENPGVFGQKRSFSDVARELDLTHEGVRTIHARALNRLRPYLEETEGSGD